MQSFIQDKNLSRTKGLLSELVETEPTVDECRRNIEGKMGPERVHYFDWMMYFEDSLKYFVTLTHDRPIHPNESMRMVEMFINKLRLYQSGYVHTSGHQPETDDERIDHHFLLPICLDLGQAKTHWRGGEVYIGKIKSVRRAVAYLCTRGSQDPTVVMKYM